MQYQYQGKNGGYQLSIENDLAICRFNGICSDAVAKHYLLDVTRLTQRRDGAPWVYAADAIDHLVAIPDAEPYLVKAYKVCLQHNCVSDAYCLSSSIAMAQLSKLRKQCSLPGSLEQRLFKTLEQAIDFVTLELNKLRAVI